ncbi:sensor histidine kinase [Methylobacterium oryzihabitans]|uniref:histidine kinase n=1 Tax=Methylobacterium oryzihabitans TaxID=2499852 RepID=A0A3S2V7L8_9HYPH|nr:ATP-binding protein [Methylobacterium oryzihabitans]RVU16310.1 HAMP domain-containing protein [Methylobacterium oryzihabitans]
MRIRNKVLLTMSVPVGLLIVQVMTVNHFVRELQAAVSFIGSAHAVIEADFVAEEMVARLRAQARQLPSRAVAAAPASAEERAAQRETWDRLDASVALITASGATKAAVPQAMAGLTEALAGARARYAEAERLAVDGAADLTTLIGPAIAAERALGDLGTALTRTTVELRRELRNAVERERAIHDRPVIAGVAIGGAAVLLLLAFTWFFVDRYLVRRLMALSGSMKAIAGGNLRVPLPPAAGADEVADMARALTVFRDTAVEVADQNLRERQVVLDTIDYGVLILDAGLGVVMHNRAFRDLWMVPEAMVRPGLAMADLLEILRRRGVYNVRDGEWRSYVDARIAAIRAGSGPPAEWRWPDGRVLQYEIVALPDGGRMLTYFDLTELKRVEAELRLAKEQAELASRAKSDFLASMSHELRTPLNAIIGITEMLVEDAESDGDTHLEEPLGRVLKAGKLLLQLINEVLDLAKIEAGKLELQPEEFDLRALVDEVVETAEPLADRRRNRIRLDADPGLGQAQTDPMRLRQILLNLLSNACKFTENGEVTVTARRHGDRLVLAVADTGIGIEPDQLPQLFQEFHQAGAAKHRKYGGTGLGLAISRRLVGLMGGDITAASEIGKGSVFTVTLPDRAPVTAAAA